MSTHRKPSFTPAAQRRWNKIQKEAQKRILNNVWCGDCLGSVQMNLQSGEMKKDMLLLKGTCKTCGKDVARVVEPESK